MATIYLYTFGSVILVSLISFIGVFFLLMKPYRLSKIIMFLVSLSAGTMLGDAALHLMPEAIENNNSSLNIWFWLLAGILMFFVLEKIVHWHHCHETGECEHTHIKILGIMNLLGDGLHNFIDGAVLAGAFLVNPTLGFATLIAVIAHEIPQEIGDLGVLVHAGYSRRKALFLNFITALSAILGAAAALIISARIENISQYILPFAAGSFIYIATSDLMPELKKDVALSKSIQQLFGIVLGIAIMYLLKILG